MMKKIAILFIAAMLGHMASAQTEAADSVQQAPVQQAEAKQTLVFGYISYDKVVRLMPEYKQAMADIEAIKAAYNEELKVSDSELNRRFSEYVKGQKTFSENILLKRQKEIQALIEQSAKFKEETQRLLDQSKEEVMQKVYARLNEAIAKVGQDKGYAFILNTDNNSCPFVNPAQGEDATAAVLAALGIE
jgi:outer membrane protein